MTMREMTSLIVPHQENIRKRKIGGPITQEREGIRMIMATAVFQVLVERIMVKKDC